MRKFEIVNSYKDKNIHLPKRGTADSAGYDLEAAEDITIPSFWKTLIPYLQLGTATMTVNEAKRYNKKIGAKATLVPTGIKIYCEKNEYIAIVPRSGIASNTNLLIPNAPGTIDADYVDNSENEGHCYVPMINLNFYDIHIKKGDRIAQAIFLPFKTTDNDATKETSRNGGFGSTGV